ncbi:MAG: metal ABC transporter substrate-binding protein [Lachnospiraceae bacterium]|nr:metal ABC transporter substrate-binding protein [Lachnospiraceae bacterium]
MKKYIPFFVATAMMVGGLSACSSNVKTSDSSNSSDSGSKSDKIQIVTTIFPEYDWVMNVLGDKKDNADVTMLLDNGVDLHSYQPTADDILKISTCDLFVYVGGESDEWVEDALAEATNKDMVVVNLMDVIGEAAKEEEMVEGMQESEHHHDHEDGEEHEHEDAEEHEHEDAEDHDHEDGEEHEDAEEHEHEHEHEEGEVEYDEHVWLSLRSAATLVDSISEALQKVDADNADTYKSNAESYISELNSLDEEYETAVSEGDKDTILFGDRFPFRYLVDDYDLNYYAAFVGCSAETEASFETITFLSEKVDELGLKAVLTIESSDKKIAETIVENTESKDQQILTMDSMQSTTSKDVEDGTSYLSIMKDNLDVLKEALK